MNHNLKNFGKLLCILAGMAFLFCLWIKQMESGKEVPKGEAITTEDVHILLQALDLEAVLEDNGDDEVLTYKEYRGIYDKIGGEDKGIPDFSEKYEDSNPFLKEDWYQAYQIMLAYYDTDSAIWKTTLFILKVDTQEKKLYTQNSEYSYVSSSFQDSAFLKEEVYIKKNQLLTSIQVLDEKTILENVWVMETTDRNMECFYHQVSFTVKTDNPVEREQVADFTFEGGKLKKTQAKQEKIHGKLLSVSEDSMEIEGYGTYEIEENMEVYKLCGILEAKQKADLMIGYDYTDFVIWKNKICACLVSREGELDNIRVLLKNTSNGSYYYNEALVTADGEETLIQADKLHNGERIILQSKALTDKVKLEVEGIDKEDCSYRGSLEFYKTKQGMVIINELPLEEYLYAVVPSEMPAAYPMEALKAQAVCARTYAFRYILHAGLADFGAHLDDTTSFQVYHNIGENAATTTAVKETTGVMLYYQGDLAQNYYYSTSCGYGTDTKIWKTSSEQDIPYIHGEKIAPKQSGSETEGDEGNALEVAKVRASAEEMEQEENFAAFITSVDASDFEKEEAWYRWKYEVEEIDADAMLERMKARYQVNNALILTRQGEGENSYYVSEPIEEIGTLRDISISKRGTGGVADEMIITGSKAVIKVISEYNIRSILCDGESMVIKQDGSTVVPKTLLPSGFFIIDAGKSGEDMVGYILIGGGYGHGVGMSQNGAKVMGSQGYGYQEILESFFAGCEVQE